MNKIVFEIRDPADARLATGTYGALYPRYQNAEYILLNFFGKPLNLPFGREINCSNQIDPSTGVLRTIEEFDFTDLFRSSNCFDDTNITTIASKTYTEQLPARGFHLLEGKVKTFSMMSKACQKSMSAYELDITSPRHPSLENYKEICFTVPPNSDFQPWNGYTGILHFGEATTRFLRNYGAIMNNKTIHILGAGDNELQLKAFVRTARSILKYTERKIEFHYVYLSHDSSISIAEDFLEFDLTFHKLPEIWEKQDGKGFSAAVFAKNIAYSFVPEGVKTVIWVDNDLMAQGDISPFADNDPADWDSPFAAVYLPKWRGPDYRIQDKVIKEGAINGGLLIQNVSKCKEMFENNGEKLLEVWKSIENFAEYPDEDLMLYASKQLNFKINHIDTVYCFPHGHLGNALFIHFIHIFKPWKRWGKYSLKNTDSHCYGAGMPWNDRSPSLRHYQETYCPITNRKTTAAGCKCVDVYVKGVRLTQDIADIFYSLKKGDYRQVIDIEVEGLNLEHIQAGDRPFVNLLLKTDAQKEHFTRLGFNWEDKQ